MQSQEEIPVTHWIRETQKGYIRVALLILLGKKPYTCAGNLTRHDCICVRALEALAVMHRGTINAANQLAHATV